MRPRQIEIGSPRTLNLRCSLPHHHHHHHRQPHSLCTPRTHSTLVRQADCQPSFPSPFDRTVDAHWRSPYPTLPPLQHNPSIAMSYTAKGALRSVKNYAKGYTDIQAKVREATSNDPWGPSGTLMNEIAQATYNQHDFMEIMEMVDKRLNDKGKNWRHVFKALTLLDYCLHMGSENVVIYAKENQYIVKTLKEFQHIDEAGKDVGANVRQKAKDITNLLSDDARLKEERRQRSAMQNRLANNSTRGFDESILWEGGIPPNREGGNRELSHDDERELQRAIEESKRSARDDEMKRHNTDSDLAKALEESERDAREKERLKREQRERQQSDADLLGGLDTTPSTFNPFPAQQDFLNPFPQQQQYDFFGNANAQYQQAQLTGFSNPYQIQAQQQAMAEEQQRQQQQQLLLQQQAIVEEQQRQQQQQHLLLQQAMAEEQQRQILQQQQQQEAARQEAARQEAARQEAARQEAARQEAARQEAARQEAARQEAARQAVLQQQQQQQQQLLIAQQQAQQQLAHHQALLLAQQQQQQQAAATQQYLAAQQQLQPTHTGTNPFGQFGQQSQSQFSPSLSSLSSFSSQQGMSPSFASQLSTSSAFPNTAKRAADERHADLVAALSKGDGMDTFGNTGNLRIPVGSGFSNTLSSEFAKPASPINTSAPNPYYGGQTSSATGDLLGLGGSSSGFGSSQSSFNRAPSPTSTFGTSGSLLDIDSNALGGGSSFGQQQSRNPFQSASSPGQWNVPARTGNQQSLNDLLGQQQRQQQLGSGFAQPQQPQFTGNFGASQFGGQQNGFGF